MANKDGTYKCFACEQKQYKIAYLTQALQQIRRIAEREGNKAPPNGKHFTMIYRIAKEVVGE